MASPAISDRSNGQTIDQTWFNVIKTWLNDLLARLDLLDAETFVISAGLLSDLTPFAPSLVPPSGSYGTVGMLTWVNQKNIKITSCQIFQQKAGSGFSQVDVQWKNGAGAWTSIFTTKPYIDATSGDNSISTSGVINTLNQNVNAGFLMRVNLDLFQKNGADLIVLISAKRN